MRDESKDMSALSRGVVDSSSTHPSSFIPHPSPLTPHPSRSAWLTLAVLFGINTMNFFDRQILAAVQEKIKEVLVLNDAPHKPEEWFVQEVIAEGDRIQIFVNGKKTVDYKDPKKTYTKGHFALQGHDPGSIMKFKKVEVKELPPTKN